MNEGFSDIFGTLIEYYGKPSAANWTIGEDFAVLRSMSNPNQYGQPDTYKGNNWATGGAGYSGVHTNSGVLNFWFYLLVNGGSGTNDKGFSYSVTSIGMTDAAATAYRTLTAYLISTSQYLNARNLSIQAASYLFGASSTQVVQVANAWDAVNVSSGSTAPPGCADNYESNEKKQSAKSIAVNTDFTSRIISSTDKDWFKFSTTNAAPKLKVTVSNLPADYDLRLYDSKGKQIATSQDTGLTAESISYNTSNIGASYYVQVYGYNGANSSNCYTLSAATSNVNQLMDLQGEVQNTSSVKGTVEAIANDIIVVYPNPASDKLSLNFSSAESGYQDVRITDYVGRELLKEKVYIQAGNNGIHLSVAVLPSGIYFLYVPEKEIMKFVIAK